MTFREATSLETLIRYAVDEAQDLGRKDVADMLRIALDNLTSRTQCKAAKPPVRLVRVGQA